MERQVKVGRRCDLSDDLGYETRVALYDALPSTTGKYSCCLPLERLKASLVAHAPPPALPQALHAEVAELRAECTACSSSSESLGVLCNSIAVKLRT